MLETVEFPCTLIGIFFFFLLFFSIYIVHDEVKDKAFELELSWVGEGKIISVTIIHLALELPTNIPDSSTYSIVELLLKYKIKIN